MLILVPRKISAAHSWFSLIISQDFPSSGWQPNLGPKWHSVAHHLSYWQQWSHWQQGGGGCPRTNHNSANIQFLKISAFYQKVYNTESCNFLIFRWCFWVISYFKVKRNPVYFPFTFPVYQIIWKKYCVAIYFLKNILILQLLMEKSFVKF